MKNPLETVTGAVICGLLLTVVLVFVVQNLA